MKVAITAAQARRREATLGTAAFVLPPRAFDVLLFLYMQRPGLPLSSRDMADALAGADGGPDSFELIIADSLYSLRRFGFPLTHRVGWGWTIEAEDRGRETDGPLSVFRIPTSRDGCFVAFLITPRGRRVVPAKRKRPKAPLRSSARPKG